MEFPSSFPASAPHAQNIVANLSPNEFFIRPQVIAAVVDILQNPSQWSNPTYDAIGKDIMQMMLLIKTEKVTELTLDRIEYAYEHQDERREKEARAAMDLQRELATLNYGDHWTRRS